MSATEMKQALFFPPGTPLVALPNWERPRLLLARSGARSAWQVSDFYPAFRLPARLYKVALRARATLGLGVRETSARGGWALGAFVAPVLPGVTSAALLVGTPGPAQKLTVQLRRGGQVVGYLKYAEKLAARERLEREHQVLSALPLGVGPEALKFGAFGEGTALVTAAVPGKALPARLPASADVNRFLNRLARPEQRAIDAFPCVQEMRAYAPELVEPWAQTLGGSPWPLVYHHGDCTPWNLLRDADGELRAIDWEYGTAEGLPYLDAVYFTLQVAFLIYRWPAPRAKTAALETLGALPAAQAEAFVNLTALYAHLQASRDGHAPDTPLQRWRRDVWEYDVWEDNVWKGGA